MRWVRVAITAAIGVVALLALSPSAQAAFGLTDLTAEPSDPAAGANSDFNIALQITDPGSDLKDLTIHLPPGLVGNPLATTTCSEDQLAADACPAASDVGDVSNDVTLHVLGFLPVNQTVRGDLFNVAPRAGEPARFGIVLDASPIPGIPGGIFPKIILQSAASLRQSDFGLDTVLTDLPNTVSILGMSSDIDIRGVALTLNGLAGDPPQGFIRNPTSCGAHTVGFDADSYDSQTASGSTSFDTVNCAALPFTPELSARIKRTGPINEPVELSTTISQTVEEAGLRRAQVILPTNIGGNNAILTNSCTNAAFQAGNCPQRSIVGSAMAGSPLLSQPLSGTVALVEPAAPGLPDIGIDLRGQLALKLKGTLGITPEGRNVVVFDGLPDIPIADFTLTFAGGPDGLVAAARDVCTPPDVIFDANFLAHSGATRSQSVAAKIDCKGATGGGGNGGHKPKATIRVSKRGSNKPRLRMKITAGSDKLRSAKVKLPRQLALASGKRFNRGISLGNQVSAKHTRRALKLKAGRPVKKFAALLADGAVQPGKGLSGHTKLRFKLKLRDTAGKRTKLTVRAK
jgi:hypothetical protein